MPNKNITPRESVKRTLREKFKTETARNVSMDIYDYVDPDIGDGEELAQRVPWYPEEYVPLDERQKK